MKKKLLGVGAIVMLSLAGCFETKLNLIKPEQAKVSAEYVGDWRFKDPEGKEGELVNLIVRNFNGREYYAEWSAKGEKTARINAIMGEIKGATFAQLTGLTEDATLEEKHLIMRVEIKDGKLNLRRLKEGFFEGVDTEEKLKSKITENIDNAEMYEGEALIATKVEAEAAH